MASSSGAKRKIDAISTTPEGLSNSSLKLGEPAKKKLKLADENSDCS